MGNAYTSVPLPSNYLVKDFTIDNDEVYFVGEIGTVQSSVGFFSIPNVLGGVGTIEYFPFPTLPNITPYDPTASHQLTFGDFDRIRYFKDGIRGHLMVIGNMNDLIDNTYSIDTRCIIDCDLASQSLEFAYNYMDEEWFDDIIAMRDTVVLLARKGKPGSYLHPPIMRLFPRNPFSLWDPTGEIESTQTNNLCRNRIFATLMEENNFMTCYHTRVSVTPPYEGLVLNTYSVSSGTIIPQQSVYLDQGSVISSACQVRGICYDSVSHFAAVLQRMDATLFPTPETAVCKFDFNTYPINADASFYYGDDLESLSMINSNLSVCSGTISGMLGITVEKLYTNTLCVSSMPLKTDEDSGGDFITERHPLYIDHAPLPGIKIPVTSRKSFVQTPCINW